MSATERLSSRLIAGNAVDAIIHFAGSIVVPEFGRRSARLLSQQHLKSRALIAAAVEAKVPHFIFSSTAAVYGMPEEIRSPRTRRSSRSRPMAAPS